MAVRKQSNVTTPFSQKSALPSIFHTARVSEGNRTLARFGAGMGMLTCAHTSFQLEHIEKKTRTQAVLFKAQK
jgi:hypothetical protein